MTTTIKSGAGVSRYLRLYRVLSQALAEGRFGAGEPLPSEPQLMRDYGISRSTVRRALARLEAEGRIERKRGSGTFAGHNGEEAAASRDLSPLLDGTAGQPAAVTSRMITFQRIPTPPFLLSEQLGFGTAALLIRRIRCIEREPVALETTYLQGDLGDRLTRQQFTGDGRPVLTILADLGHRSPSVEREFAAAEADPFAAGSLELAVGAPVFNVRTLARGPGDRLLAYVDCLYRPDRYEAHAAIKLDDTRRRPRAGKRN